jgi:hypothetical protein
MKRKTGFNKMSSLYLLDTNTYYLLFQPIKVQAYKDLVDKLTENNVISFYISEITSLEIHSVVGKYRRGTPAQIQTCKRKILMDGVRINCPHNWVVDEQKRLKPKIFRDLQKMISDIENQKGIIQATILPLNFIAMSKAKEFLIYYADRFNFGSHDALVAGTAMALKETSGLQLIVVTSDRSFKAALSCKGIPYFDPNYNGS